jgi:SecD/SecF fusion protein
MYTPRWKLVTYALILLLGLAALLPNALTPAQRAALPGWLSGGTITLGLDLRGGSYLALEVDGKALVAERLEALAGEARELLRAAGLKGYRLHVADGAVELRLNSADLAGPVQQALRPLVGPAVAQSRDGDVVRLALTEAGVADRLDAAAKQSLEIVRKRIDEVGVVEPIVQRAGPSRIVVQLPGVQDPSRIKALLGSTAKLTFHRVVAPGAAGEGTRVLWDSAHQERFTVERRPVLSGERLVQAEPGIDGQTGQPVVNFRFDAAGGRAFADFTRGHVNEPMAIVLDGKVLSAPVIREPILGGSGQISGRFNVQEVTDLAALLRAGALPVPLTIVEERTVGPELGQDAIDRGFATGLVGLVLVIGFMVALYRGWGLIASTAVSINLLLTLAALSVLNATLTLPGIAGIVLGIGFAVDANVLINERIREETHKGLSAFAALDAGFKRAYATIVDANVTTLIATTLLFLVGSGSVQGFAVTMGLGILISMLTAVGFVKVAMIGIVRRRRLKTLNIEPLVRLVPQTTFRFMRGRFLGLALSAVLSLGSVALFIAPGLNYGVDFKGGIQLSVTSPRAVDLAPLRVQLDGLGLGEVGLQQFGDAGNLLIRLQEQDGGEAAQTAALATLKAAVHQALPEASIASADVVGPKVSGELARAGLVAVGLAMLAMLAYIWFRFEWPFAVGAIATLLLDATKMVGFFALTGLTFNLPAIAALLTLIGFSVNDKVVVYDRMRENMRLYKQMPLRQIIDKSINETLARSIYTSATAFLAMAPMAVWGGTAVESFAVPMLFGIVVATSSSIFIAAPILLFLGDWRRRRAAARPAETPAVESQPAH